MPKKFKVFIVGPTFEYERMFQQEGWEVVRSMDKADLVQFVGGADVDSRLYGEPRHAKTLCDPARDAHEKLVYELALKKAKPMAGICRGAQFLNVMCGGKLWQDVDNHNKGGTHPAKDELTGEVFNVTSTHHQMMRPTDDAFIIVTASESMTKHGMIGAGIPWSQHGSEEPDIEACWYMDQNCFCFQPHPEFRAYHDLRKRYIDYVLSWCFNTTRES